MNYPFILQRLACGKRIVKRKKRKAALPPVDLRCCQNFSLFSFLFSLIIAFAAWTAPLVTHAQNYAVSPAVLSVLDRADQGIAASKNSPNLGIFLPNAVSEWSRYILTPVMQRMDARMRGIEQAGESMQRTTCLQLDVTMLETKMEAVRTLMGTALSQNNVFAMVRLADLFMFLDERYWYLTQGALNPEISDWLYQYPRVFDTVTPSEGPVCYYHSDYTSPGFIMPGRDGYGCDPSRLDRIWNEWGNTPQGNLFPVLQQDIIRERDTLAQVQSAVSQYLAGAETINATAKAMETIAAGGTLPEPPVPEPRKHLTEQGCMAEPSAGVVAHPLNGPFDVTPDESRLAQEFSRLWMDGEALRPTPPSIVEYADPAQQLFNFFRAAERRVLSVFSQNQAGRQSASFMAGADPVLSTAQGLTGLGTAVAGLGALVTDVDQLRSFTSEFGFFLLRTCIERPCRERLEKALRIVFQNECFPYFSGAYLGDTPENPRWRKCMEAAEITEDRAPDAIGSACPPVITRCLGDYTACISDVENVCGVSLAQSKTAWCSSYTMGGGGLPPAQYLPAPPDMPNTPQCMAQGTACAAQYMACRSQVIAACVTTEDIRTVTDRITGWCQ